MSWLVLGGKCSACRSKISLKYPLVEALAGLGAAYAAWRFGATATALGAVLFIWFTIALAFIDQETGLLPDSLTLPLVWIGLLVNLAGGFVSLAGCRHRRGGRLHGALVVFHAYRLATGRKAWVTATSR